MPRQPIPRRCCSGRCITVHYLKENQNHALCLYGYAGLAASQASRQSPARPSRPHVALFVLTEAD
jgi:hypothetical protein